MSDRPKKTRSDGLSQPQNNSDMGELREGFDEIYGNMDGFSKRAVGSLFDDDENSSEKADKPKNPPRNSSSRPARPSREESAERLGRIGMHDEEPPSRPSRPERSGSTHTRESDPDEAYARYIRTAEQANRIDQERQRADKQQALMERDEKLNEVSYISRRREDTTSRAKVMEETDLYAYKNRGDRQLNLRNIAAIGAFLVLVVMALLTWQMLSARSQLAVANDRLDTLETLEQENSSLRIENNGLENDISLLNAEIADLEERLEIQVNILGAINPGTSNDENGAATAENGGATEVTQTQPTAGDLPHTTLNAQGQRVYTVQPGDTMWSIAMRVYNDGSRYGDILTANNMTAAQAAGLAVGAVLVIPD